MLVSDGTARQCVGTVFMLVSSETSIVWFYELYDWSSRTISGFPFVSVERLIRDNCQIDGDDLINYADFIQSIKDRYEEMNSVHY